MGLLTFIQVPVSSDIRVLLFSQCREAALQMSQVWFRQEGENGSWCEGAVFCNVKIKYFGIIYPKPQV